MLGFPVTSLDSEVEVSVCVCPAEEYTPGGAEPPDDADGLIPVAASAPISVRDLAGGGRVGENDIWCPLAKAEVGSKEKMYNMMRKSGKSGKGMMATMMNKKYTDTAASPSASAAGRIHLKMRFVPADVSSHLDSPQPATCLSALHSPQQRFSCAQRLLFPQFASSPPPVRPVMSVAMADTLLVSTAQH